MSEKDELSDNDRKQIDIEDLKSENELLKRKLEKEIEQREQLLSKLKYQYVITDPFPEHSRYQSLERSSSAFEKLFGTSKKAISIPEPISIWKAYRMGQEDVYRRLEGVK